MMEKSGRFFDGQGIAIGALYFADFIEKSHGTPKDVIDDILRQLHRRKDEWIKLSIIERLEILDEIHADLLRVKDQWIEAELIAKGIEPGSTGEAEEWGILATVFRSVRILRRSLVEIKNRVSDRANFSNLVVFGLGFECRITQFRNHIVDTRFNGFFGRRRQTLKG